MAWSAELHYMPLPEQPDRLIVTGTSTGKAPPRYVWTDETDPDQREGIKSYLEEFYQVGLYGTGSPGEVRDMLHAMQRYSDMSRGYIELRVPPETQRKAEEEAEAAAAALPEGAVW